jgi:ribonuclease G
MKIELITDSILNESRLALLEDGELAEIYVERADNKRIVGNIYNGRVANILPGMDAAFVDVGLDKNAFLHAGDILADQSDFEFTGERPPAEIQPNIKQILKQGQYLMVQVLKDPSGTKGAKVTTHITLPGRMMVLMPTVNYIGVSRRIEGEEERSRLKDIMERIKPPGMGVIVRTVGEGKQEQDFIEEAKALCRLWESIHQSWEKKKKPALVHSEGDMLYCAIRDLFTNEVDSFVVHKDHYDDVLELTNMLAPHLADRIALYDGDSPFEAYGIEHKIERALHRRVWLKSGGCLIFDTTEALTVVDVNTGKFVGHSNLKNTILQTNVEAAKEIARQLRLRHVSGIIIIDFIDMEDETAKATVVDTLSEALKRDRNKSNVLGMTGLGLVELTRKKSRQRLASVMQLTCPLCSGAGVIYSPQTVALNLARNVLFLLKNSSVDAVVVNVHPSVARYIGERSKKQPFFGDLSGKRIYIRANHRIHQERFEMEAYNLPSDADGCDIYG